MTNERPSLAQDFFLNLGVMATLYAVVVAFLSLVFSIVNRVFPDALNGYYGDPYSSGVRFAMATLIIVFPLFVWLSRSITKAILDNAERRNSVIRRWMVYITLFLASATLVVDLVVALNSFLSGDLTTRFALKALAVLIVAGMIFWHYLGEIRETNTYKKYVVSVSVAGILVLAGIITAFAVFGSPSSVRAIRFDDQRVSHLQQIQWQVVNYYQGKGEVPANLDYLKDPISSFMVPVDPQTSTAYAYSKTGPLSFRLCATFNKASDGKRNSYGMDYGYPLPVGGHELENWKHEAGEHCFDRTIDPDFYPVNDVLIQKRAASMVR
ncbi:MAG: DUF5671 domain-containing protein [bacterium]|nr:DUF5671 domain-containing protein [bacterium]